VPSTSQVLLLIKFLVEMNESLKSLTAIKPLSKVYVVSL